MSGGCTHDISEREVAVAADGHCSICFSRRDRTVEKRTRGGESGEQSGGYYHGKPVVEMIEESLRAVRRFSPLKELTTPILELRQNKIKELQERERVMRTALEKINNMEVSPHRKGMASHLYGHAQAIACAALKTIRESSPQKESEPHG